MIISSGLRVELTIMIVKHIGLADANHTLSTRGISFAIRSINHSATTLDEIIASLVNEWTSWALGPAHANAVSRGLSANKIE